MMNAAPKKILDWSSLPDCIMQCLHSDIDHITKKKYMQLAIESAKKSGSHRIRVGTVVVKDDRVLGLGYDYRDFILRYFHAEHIALRKAGALAKGADLYTTLEPCNFRGGIKSKFYGFFPCCELILRYGIKRVIVGMVDSAKRIQGKSILYLVEQGLFVDRCSLELETELYHLLKN